MKSAMEELAGSLDIFSKGSPDILAWKSHYKL